MEKEIRSWNVDLSTEKREGYETKTLKGHSAIFNSLSGDLGGFREKIAPGAFKKALKKSDVRALFNHDPNYVLGRTKNGTLRLQETKDGLHMEVDPPTTQLIKDMVIAPVERGDIDQQSFAFTVGKDKWDGLDSDNPVRTILEFKELYDVSVVTYPAYEDTAVALRSMNTAKSEPMPLNRSEEPSLPGHTVEDSKIFEKLTQLEERYKK